MNIDKVINQLNELNKSDPKVTYELFTEQVNVDEMLIKENSNFMCGKKNYSFIVKPLGLINGWLKTTLLTWN